MIENIRPELGVCSTSADAVTKTVTLKKFTLNIGSQVLVKFDNTNTASEPKLNVNYTGAKPIYYHNHNVPTSMLMSGGVYLFVYDGDRWQLIGNHFAGSNGNELGALQFYNALKNSYFSGDNITFDHVNENQIGYGNTEIPVFVPAYPSHDDSNKTGIYGKINFGSFVAQGYKKLLFDVIFPNFHSKAQTLTVYVSTSPSISDAVLQQFCRNYTNFGAAISFDSTQRILLDISNLTGQYYFILSMDYDDVSSMSNSATAVSALLLS